MVVGVGIQADDVIGAQELGHLEGAGADGFEFCSVQVEAASPRQFANWAFAGSAAPKAEEQVRGAAWWLAGPGHGLD